MTAVLPEMDISLLKELALERVEINSAVHHGLPQSGDMH